jgi:hypothetical protein
MCALKLKAHRATPSPLSARVKALGKPAVDRSEKLARLIPLALIAPETGHAHRGAQLPGLGLLLASNGERAVEICFCFCCISFLRLEGDFPGDAIDLSFAPSFLVSTTVRASPMQRQASPNWPSSA